MKTYYDLLDVPIKATPVQVQSTFRRFVARYRLLLDVDQLFTDTRFVDRLNAYLTLTGEARKEYESQYACAQDTETLPAPRPFDQLTDEQKLLFKARIAFWRRQIVDAIHQLRLVLEQNPDSASAWALLGEVYLTVGRVEDGAHAYQRAASGAPDQKAYADRLQHARDVLDGKATLQVEVSPEDEMLLEERRRRMRITIPVLLAGIAIVTFSFFIPITRDRLGFLNIPWLMVAQQAIGLMLLMLALGFGRLIRPYEQVMIWTSLTIGDRGRFRDLPRGLLFLAMSAGSLWVAVLGFIIMSSLDEEWPGAVTLMMILCALINIGFGTVMYIAHLTDPVVSWGNGLIFGGNFLVPVAMLGWYIGSFGAPSAD